MALPMTTLTDLANWHVGLGFRAKIYKPFYLTLFSMFAACIDVSLSCFEHPWHCL